jgi:hypothetical protein
MIIRDSDQAYLLESLTKNRCVLFAGAGFSANANNKFDAPIPDARTLAKVLWDWLRFPGEYDESPLGEVFQSALDSGRPGRP